MFFHEGDRTLLHDLGESLAVLTAEQDLLGSKIQKNNDKIEEVKNLLDEMQALFELVLASQQAAKPKPRKKRKSKNDNADKQ